MNNSIQRRLEALEQRLKIGCISLRMPDGSVRRIPADSRFLLSLFSAACDWSHAKLDGLPLPSTYAGELEAVCNSISDDAEAQGAGRMLELLRAVVEGPVEVKP